MPTRSKPRFQKPRLNPTLLLTHLEPTSAQKALAHPHQMAAMRPEYESLVENLLTLVPLPYWREAKCLQIFQVQ